MKPTSAARHPRATGTVTRGTTAPNRLRRVDAWTVHALRRTLLASPEAPLAIDVGFGAWPVTTVELADRLRRVRPDLRVVGLEIDPERVAQAQQYASADVTFEHGGFELGAPVAAGERPVLVRAFNVLRQYDEADVEAAWRTMAARLDPSGVLIEGTCDEPGRRATWVRIDVNARPVSLTFAARLAGLDTPASLAERLPKVLIHRNVPGEPVHAFVSAWDAAWRRSAGRAVFGARQRWVEVAATLRQDGWPVLAGPSRWRLGELTVAWEAVAPR